jgi:hypothetical protein
MVIFTLASSAEGLELTQEEIERAIVELEREFATEQS